MSGGVIDFDSELSRHAEFFGRSDVLDKIDDLIHGPRALSRGWVLLRGGPGVGKSAILTQVIEKNGRSVPHHLIRRGIEGWDRPEIIVQNLRAQIEERFPGLRGAEASPQDGLYGLLKRVSDMELFRDRRLLQRLVLVIDGLDEAADDGSGKSPLSRFLPSHLPTGVVILCASRPTHQPNWLEQRDKVCIIDLDDSTWSRSNQEAVRGVFEHYGPSFSPPLERAHMEDAIERSDGNLLYAVRLCELLELQPREQRTARIIPQGLSGLYEEPLSDVRKLDPAQHRLMMRGLGILCVAREALGLYLFSEILGGEWTEVESDAFLRILRPILFQEREQKAYRLYHEHFREVIAQRLGPTELREYDRLLARTIALWKPDERDTFRRGYALRYAVAHRLRAGDVHDAQRLCMDVGYMDAKCRELGVSAVEQDLEATVRAGGADVPPELLDIATAVSLEASKLHSDRSALPVLLYNRLLYAGWSPDRIERVLHFPSGLPALRLLHPVRLGTSLFRTLRGHEKEVVACSLIPGGRFVLSASSDRALRLWALSSGECVGEMREHGDQITSCAPMSDGRRAVSTSLDGTAKVWDLETRRVLVTLSNEGCWATECAVTPDDRYVVVGSDNGVLRVFDGETGACVHHLTGPSAYVSACIVTSDRLCISASRDGSVCLWDVVEGKLIKTLPFPGSAAPVAPEAMDESRWITALAMLDESRVIVAYGDESVVLWDLDSGTHTKSRIGGQGRVDACAVTSDGRFLLCGMKDGAIALWDLASERQIDHMTAHTGSVSACAIVPGSRRAVTASHDGSLKLLELATMETVQPREQHTEMVAACAMTPRGAVAITASEDRSAKIWDLLSGDPRTLVVCDARLTAIALSADGNRALLGAQNGRLTLLGMPDGEHIDELNEHTGSITGCVFVSMERILSASEDGALRFWDRAAGVNRILGQHSGGMVGCAATPDGATALAMWRSGAVMLLRFTTGAPEQVSLRFRAGLRAGALTPDGRHIVLGFESGMLEICDLPSGMLRTVIPAHTQGILGCTVMPDGARVVSASKDRTLKIHCMITKKCLASFPGAAWFRCVAASEERICAGDQDGNVWIVAASAAEIDRVSLNSDDLPRRSSRSAASKPAPSVSSKASEPRSSKTATARSASPSPKPTRSFSKNPPLLTPPKRGRTDSRSIQDATYDELAPLREVLAGLYKTTEEAQLIASDIRLDVRSCNLSGIPRLLWYGLLKAAKHQRCLDKLIQRARKDFPSHEALEQAARELGYE